MRWSPSIKKEQSRQFSAVRFIVSLYFLATIISTILLSMPFVYNDYADWSFINALFTAVSAISVTGLTVVPTAETYTVAGKFILAIILEFGGIGIMTFGTFFWILLGKRIGLKERKLIMTDQNQHTFSGLVDLLKQILIIILIVEAMGAIILSIYFLQFFDTWQEAWFHGFFASVSATTNAGFDITGASLIPFAHDYFVQSITMILLIFGAIGFPVLIETKDFILSKRDSHFRFSLYTKITTTTFFGLLLFGAIAIYVLERNAFLFHKTWHESLFYSLFQSVTTRNGGLATMDLNEFTTPTLIVLCILMFIGASPSSVGGGIRTTTFAIMVLAIFNYAKGRTAIKVFRREIAQEDVIRSFIVISTASLICMTAVVLLSYLEPFSLTEIVFEVCSAFGTTGLSLGITAELSTWGKVIIITIMFIGRIGIFSLLFLIRGSSPSDLYHYPKEKMIIG